MTPAKSSAPRSTTSETSIPVPLSDAADALFRSAVEACRQHERVARVSDRGCSDEELRELAEVCEVGHRHLAARTAAWETAAAEGQGKNDESFWHAANTLWHASREYARRHHSCHALHAIISRRSTDALVAL